MADSGTVIVGAGQAGYQAAAQLRLKGYTAPITLIGDEDHLPYQQPPLSKAYLQGDLDGDRLPFRPEAFYPDKDIELRLGEAVTAIDTNARTVTTAAGTLPYQHLIIATGGTPRRIPVPEHLENRCFTLKTRDDADALGEALAKAETIAIVGAGFIGLEVAATAAKAGKAVTVFEMQDRILARVASPPSPRRWMPDTGRPGSTCASMKGSTSTASKPTSSCWGSAACRCRASRKPLASPAMAVS